MEKNIIINMIQNFLEQPIRLNHSLQGDLDLDSLDIAELVCHLERKLNFDLEIEADDRLETVEDLIGLVLASNGHAPAQAKSAAGHA